MVVPLNGSSAQLQECLRSLAEQTLRDLEVVLVDSGGPEGAERRALAERFAAVDGRFRLVRHPPGEPGNPDNRAEPGSAGGMVGSGGAGGAGDARAAGLREVDPGSRFLAFCDGADRLPPTAYELLTDSLTASGSDLACGDLLRLRHTGSTSSTSGTSGTGRPASDSEPAAAEHDPAAWTLSAHGPLRKAMDQPRQRTHITRHPALVQDRTLRNKVFRHAFWTHRQLPWPARTPSHAGRLGPDTALALPAHYLAESVDVLTEPVCHWREQPSARSTASPVRTDQAALRADVAVLEEVSRRLAEHAAEDGGAAERHYAALVLAGDLLAYLKALPAADEEFRALFTRLAAGFLTRVDPRVLDGLPVGRRMKWQLVREHRTTDLLHALAFERENPRVFETTGPRARRAAYLRPDGSGITVPDRASRPLREDLPLRTKLHAVDWLPDGRLRLRGQAYVRSLDAGAYGRSTKLGWLRRRGSRLRTPVRVRTVPAPEATRHSKQWLHSYDAAGFEIVLDPARLLSGLGRSRRTGTWTLGLGVLTGGVFRHGGVAAGTDGSGAQPAARETGDGRRIVPTFRDGLFRIVVEEIPARLEGHRLADGDLELTGSVRARYAAQRLRLTHQRSGRVLEYPLRLTEAAERSPDGRGRFAARVPLKDLAEARTEANASRTDASGADAYDGPGSNGDPGGGSAGDPQRAEGEGTRDERPDDPESAPAAEPRARTSDAWRASLVLTEDATCRMLAPPHAAPGDYALGVDPRLDGAYRELCLVPDAAGRLLLADRTPQPVVHSWHWSPDGGLTLSGRRTLGRPGDPEPSGEWELVWRHSGHQAEVVVPVERDGHRFTARLAPETAAPGALPLRQGRWDPYLRARGGDRTGNAPLRLRAELHGELPSAHQAAREYVLERRNHDRLFLRSGSLLSDSERGAYRQHRLRTVRYPAAREAPPWDVVLYNSFDGRQYSDSPRALHEELLRRGAAVRHLWAVRDGQAHVPPEARPVVLGSSEWHEALARSRWIVGNTHLPRWFRRREDQLTVQTWHGTPLKRIGLDLADSAYANQEYLAQLPARAAQWSLLLSPNSFSTPILRRAFGYAGEILESGYPRNDLLYAADRHKRARQVRERLDIPTGHRVVLYAPTWRDDNRYDRANGRFDMRLDPDAARAALGTDHVLLVRKHYRVADAVPGAGHGFVRDVSAWPDIAELLLIADVLVTDYSSLMFDFAHTGRPMFFFTYDLDRYRDVLRGFYFDFAERAPGPLLSDSDAVIDALRDVDTVAAAYEGRYAQFRQAFCDLDDGRAAARVAERMFAEAPGILPSAAGSGAAGQPRHAAPGSVADPAVAPARTRTVPVAASGRGGEGIQATSETQAASETNGTGRTGEADAADETAEAAGTSGPPRPGDTPATGQTRDTEVSRHGPTGG
ncbi:bifunctional glycosyltransferase/CDP-glycerol:glycerophosphate glycerophosphotransferase [Streptomyces oceani]|uniref:bifunctional glycosyltransferase/CDP-glycerol:glycerophosphate glycerophosphotransferase n=1 Tax=Streptomyces oceani TaxID=1075402 RepID=UPI00147E1BF1|nr:CDP-glycerol:glycerophosphate glycerophosphotransferase [Streptomyces oceani]